MDFLVIKNKLSTVYVFAKITVIRQPKSKIRKCVQKFNSEKLVIRFIPVIGL